MHHRIFLTAPREHLLLLGKHVRYHLLQDLDDAGALLPEQD